MFVLIVFSHVKNGTFQSFEKNYHWSQREEEAVAMNFIFFSFHVSYCPEERVFMNILCVTLDASPGECFVQRKMCDLNSHSNPVPLREIFGQKHLLKLSLTFI